MVVFSSSCRPCAPVVADNVVTCRCRRFLVHWRPRPFSGIALKALDHQQIEKILKKRTRSLLFPFMPDEGARFAVIPGKVIRPLRNYFVTAAAVESGGEAEA